ncbi:MAG: LegC family aminotransferase [Flavobacteriales bacterium]|nr:LegC family aminotransferase [Flavobacteriales bacterium]
MPNAIISAIKELYPSKSIIPLHEPLIGKAEKDNVTKCLESTFISNSGEYIDLFEKKIKELSGAKYALAVNSGTSALHLSLAGLNIKPGDEVITQSFSFVATANAISYHGATPIFMDIDDQTLGMAPNNLFNFLNEMVDVKDGIPFNIETGKNIAACIPVHTLGHPCEIEDILAICEEVNLPVLEDAAAAFGSTFNNQQVGTFGKAGAFSFNGNKLFTTGGGGAIVTDDEELYNTISHLAKVAKVEDSINLLHDKIGYNCKISNLHAAVGCAQLDRFNEFLENKRNLASEYTNSFSDLEAELIQEPINCKSNYWMNALLFKNTSSKEVFIRESQKEGILAKAAWTPLPELEMYKSCLCDDLEVTNDLVNRMAFIPSSLLLE